MSYPMLYSDWLRTGEIAYRFHPPRPDDTWYCEVCRKLFKVDYSDNTGIIINKCDCVQYLLNG